MQKLLVVIIFILGLALCGILVLIGFAPSIDHAAGLAHPTFGGMRIGGDGAARIEPIKALAFTFQILVLAQFACFIALGVRVNRRSPTFYTLLSGCFLLTALVWWQLFSGHQNYLASGETQYILGFPAATAWLIYGIWLSGMSFVALYVVGFKHYVWSDQNEKDFQKLVQDHQHDL